ncbi:MAG TPA: sulfotransferase [Tepidisphaeraceae bacterium]|nr:sulfotransferase [Tepidisphaeraceae bacterium]
MADQPTSNAEADPRSHARNLALQGDAFFNEANYQAAFNCFRQCVRLRPAYAGYHHRLALAASKAGYPGDVERHYQEAIRLDPRLCEPHKALAQWLLIHGNIERALHHSGAAHVLAPLDLDTIVTRVAVLDADGQAKQAWTLLEPVISAGSIVWHALVAYARLAPRIGHERQAIGLIQKTLRDGGHSKWQASALNFAVVSLLDAIGDYDRAFSHAHLANELVRPDFDSLANSRVIDDKIRRFTPALLRSLPPATRSTPRPVFIVGMPRSGTTLLEQILASHPAIFGCGELPALHDAASSLQGQQSPRNSRDPDGLDLLTPAIADRLAADYMRATDLLDTSAAYVTDKMPGNFDRLWLAEALFPRCHVIHCIRDPRDTCLSCYLTDFEKGNAFSFDLANLASFYRDYRRLMNHWKAVLRVPILEVRYEALVADVKGQTVRMLDFLSVPWNDACLDFHKSKRMANTASREQVRRPLYSSSVGRWRHYEKHIPQLLGLAPESF